MIKLTGLKEFQKSIDTLTKKVRALERKQTVPVTDILTSNFVSKHTKFTSAQELFENSGFKLDSQADFEAIPEEAMDSYIRSVSTFKSWKEMLSAAGESYVKRELGL